MSVPKEEGYYKHPEGTDCFGKMLATNKIAATTGLAWSIIDVMMVARTKGYIPTLARFAYNIGPMLGMASAFTLTTYMATNARAKDDRLNYFLGGMAAGGVWGAWRRNHVSGLVMGLAFGIAGVIKKTSKIEGWEFFPPMKHRENTSIYDIDLTLLAERPKNWSTGK